MALWRGALPPQTLLEVPYEELVLDQEKWTRRILEFMKFPWDDGCLNFQAAAAHRPGPFVETPRTGRDCGLPTPGRFVTQFTRNP